MLKQLFRHNLTPTTGFSNSLSTIETKCQQWVSKLLHDLSSNSGTYPYWFLSQIFIAIKLRFPSGKFYAEWKEKTESLQTFVQKEVIDFDTLLCPNVEEIVTPIKNFTCALHSLHLLEKQKKKNCAKKSTVIFLWAHTACQGTIQLRRKLIQFFT